MGDMREGILNEPVRECAERLMEAFGDQMGLRFGNLIFIAVTEDGLFRTANCSNDAPLTKEAVRLVAKHLEEWAETFGE